MHATLPRLATAPTPAIAFNPEIERALRAGAHIVYSLSGGKDSSAAAFATQPWLDSIGHPRDRRHAIHADLGTIEWRSTEPFVREVAQRLSVPLHIVRRKAGGLIPRWRQRWKGSLARYTALETYQLVSPWSSSSLRFCTSETKVAPIGSHLKRILAGETIISVIGIRAEESASRANAPLVKHDTRFAAPGNRAGTTMLSWHPILHWSTEQVFAAHAATGFPLHEAYGMGATRLSCSYCVLASLHNLTISAQAPGNTPAFREIVDIETTSGFSFQSGRWLADVAPHLLEAVTLAELGRAKILAELRRSLEAALPADLRFCRGWPPRIPDISEAGIIADVRARLLGTLNLANRYPRPRDVRDRFAQLHRALQAGAQAGGGRLTGAPRTPMRRR
jgi:3'-phosphoadenosine 5'-phosphosulfate sulfotransferase (PAPS reductase)/FAD synthetase